jgi:hypothetical protein
VVVAAFAGDNTSGDPIDVKDLRGGFFDLLGDELGRRFGAFGPTISRLETGRRPLRDIATLRRLPVEVLGLAGHGDTAAWSSRTDTTRSCATTPRWTCAASRTRSADR